LRAEELRYGRVHQRRDPLVDPGYQGGGVYRHQRPGIVERIAAKAGVGLKLEETARPQAQLLRVDIERIIDVASEIGTGAAATAHDILGGPEQINVEYNTPLCEIVS